MSSPASDSSLPTAATAASAAASAPLSANAAPTAITDSETARGTEPALADDASSVPSKRLLVFDIFVSAGVVAGAYWQRAGIMQLADSMTFLIAMSIPLLSAISIILDYKSNKQSTPAIHYRIGISSVFTAILLLSILSTLNLYTWGLGSFLVFLTGDSFRDRAWTLLGLLTFLTHTWMVASTCLRSIERPQPAAPKSEPAVSPG
jgi:hypothetical protein